MNARGVNADQDKRITRLTLGHMRSQKSRSRSQIASQSPNWWRAGNVLNRVFDSSGPEGKVRGTPQQIIDKYNQLERDAQLSNDRVAAENFQQHAEHYTRMLNDAQREQDAHRKEQDARREEQERQNRERQAERDRERTERQEREAAQRAEEPRAAEPAVTSQPDVVVDPGAGTQPDTNDSGLVETPESSPRKPRRARTRKPAPKPVVEKTAAEEPAVEKPVAKAAAETAPAATPDEPSEAAE